MHKQKLMQRICEKSKELAMEKRKNSNLCADNLKLNSKIKKLMDNAQILTMRLQEFEENVKILETLNTKAMNEILFLKLELYKQKKFSQFEKYETQFSRNSDILADVDILNSQDSNRSEEEEPNSDDNAMIDSEYDDSNDDIDRLYEPSEERLLTEELDTSTIETDESMN